MAYWAAVVIFAAAFCAGMVNSVAGGGTLISFPTLIWIGRNPIIANATSTVALLPGSFTGMLGFRRELAGSRKWILRLAAPSLIGGSAGAFLLLHTSTHTFSLLVPYLILAATLLFAGQEIIAKKSRDTRNAEHTQKSKAWWIGAMIFQLCVGAYGGYFGAGIGILMLAGLGILGLTDIHQMNGVKNLLTLLINGVAAAYFICSGAVVWSDVVLMAAGAMLGGYFGAGLAYRLGRRVIRYTVVVIGLMMTVLMMLTR